MIVRLSQKLATKIHEQPTKSFALDENPYADWSGHLFTADRAQYIIVTNTASLYSAVFYGRGITDDNQFLRRTLDTIREVMDDDGLEFIHRRFIAPSVTMEELPRRKNGHAFGRRLIHRLADSRKKLNDAELAKLFDEKWELGLKQAVERSLPCEFDVARSRLQGKQPDFIDPDQEQRQFRFQSMDFIVQFDQQSGDSRELTQLWKVQSGDDHLKTL
jgi:hypothetical protein